MTAPRLAAILCAAALPGCVTLFSKTEVIRSDEPRRPVRFESPEAAEAFRGAREKHRGDVGGTHVGVPFVTLYSRRETLSDAAKWNDAVVRCDTDQDGVVTHAEALIYAQSAP